MQEEGSHWLSNHLQEWCLREGLTSPSCLSFRWRSHWYRNYVADWRVHWARDTCHGLVVSKSIRAPTNRCRSHQYQGSTLQFAYRHCRSSHFLSLVLVQISSNLESQTCPLQRTQWWRFCCCYSSLVGPLSIHRLLRGTWRVQQSEGPLNYDSA